MKSLWRRFADGSSRPPSQTLAALRAPTTSDAAVSFDTKLAEDGMLAAIDELADSDDKSSALDADAPL